MSFLHLHSTWETISNELREEDLDLGGELSLLDIHYLEFGRALMQSVVE